MNVFKSDVKIFLFFLLLCFVIYPFPHTFQRFLIHSSPIILHNNVHIVAFMFCCNKKFPGKFFARHSMLNCILYNRLKHILHNFSLGNSLFQIQFQLDFISKTHFLDIQISLHLANLFFQSNIISIYIHSITKHIP